MSYTKHTWTNGETVTAAKMNNIEAGIEEAASGGGVLVVTDTNGALDKTWQEIYDSLPLAVLDVPNIHTRTTFQVARTDVYGLHAGELYYAASSASGYPTRSDPPK